MRTPPEEHWEPGNGKVCGGWFRDQGLAVFLEVGGSSGGGADAWDPVDGCPFDVEDDPGAGGSEVMCRDVGFPWVSRAFKESPSDALRTP